jgi:hypothetical protein
MSAIIKNTRKVVAMSGKADAVSEKKYLAAIATAGFTLIKDSAKLDAESVALATGIKAQDKRIAEYLLSELVHIEEHRNPTRLNTFLTGIARAGARQDAMHKYVQLYFNVVFTVDNKKEPEATRRRPPIKEGNELKTTQFYNMRPKRSEDDFNVAVTKALESPWTEAIRPQVAKAFDLNAQVKRILEAALRHKAKPTEGVQDIIPEQVLISLKTLATSCGIVYEDATMSPEENSAHKEAIEHAHPAPAELIKGEAANGNGNAVETQAKKRGRPVGSGHSAASAA